MRILTGLIMLVILAVVLIACDDSSGILSGDNPNSSGGISQAEADRLQQEIERLKEEQNNASGDGNGNNPGGESRSPYASTTVGDIINIGGLDWRVLAVLDGKMLVISDKILENRAYHAEGGAITWEHSGLREFLNGPFYDTTFSSHEREWIIETRIINNDNTTHGTSGGNDTTDKVFLLSVDDVNDHMGDNSHINSRNARIAVNLVTGNTGWWWLRSPGSNSNDVVCVCTRGDYSGRLHIVDGVSNPHGGVRPAMWITL
jgi:hypothetical protein